MNRRLHDRVRTQLPEQGYQVMANVLLLADYRHGELKKATLNALSFARDAAKRIGGDLVILVLGKEVSGLARKAAKYGAAKVIAAEADGLENYQSETWGAVAASVAQSQDAGIVCMASTSTGKDMMPRIAARLKAGMVSDALGFDGLTYTRAVWAGNAIATVEVTTAVTVCTVQTTAFETAGESADSPVELFHPTLPEAKARFVAFEKTAGEGPDLTEADVVVSGGRGMKAAENFKMLEELAGLFNGAVGATRAAVDHGWAPNDIQVGQTGKIVAPNLYFAIGLSGATQHLAGARNSKWILAINKDENAPIFQSADFGLVADLFHALPELTEILRREIGKV